MKKCLCGCFFPVEFFKREKNEKLEISRKHLTKYINELKRHFDLTDNEVRKLLCHTLNANKPQGPLEKLLNVLKL